MGIGMGPLDVRFELKDEDEWRQARAFAEMCFDLHMQFVKAYGQITNHEGDSFVPNDLKTAVLIAVDRQFYESALKASMEGPGALNYSEEEMLAFKEKLIKKKGA